MHHRSFALIVLTLVLVASPASAEIEVTFGTVFDAQKNPKVGVWIIGVDCGDGVVQGAGLCADDPEDCATSAAKKMCGSSAAGGQDTDSSGWVPADQFDQHQLDAARLNRGQLIEVPGDSLGEADDPEQRARGQRVELLRSLKNLIAVRQQQLSHDVWSPTGPTPTCYYPGPGCPGWEERCAELGLCGPFGPDVLFREGTGGEPGSDEASVSNLFWSAGTFMVKLVYCSVKIEVEGYEAGIQDPLDGPDGFKKLKECVGSIPLSLAPAARWTRWLNRDRPGGSGDWETLEAFRSAQEVCATPAAIECATIDGRDWRETGQEYECSLERGGICRNASQTGGRCADYRVRFLCD